MALRFATFRRILFYFDCRSLIADRSMRRKSSQRPFLAAILIPTVVLWSFVGLDDSSAQTTS